MSSKIALSVFAAVMLGFLALVPLAYPEATSLLWWRIAAIAAFLLGVGALWRQGILQSREEIRTHSLLEKIASNLSTNQTQNSPLRERTAKLSYDLLALLKEQGPEPPHPEDNLRTTDKEWKAIGDQHWPYVNKLQHRYARLMHQRVADLLHELAENDLNAPSEEEFGIHPSQRVPASGVRELAERLLLISAKMN